MTALAVVGFNTGAFLTGIVAAALVPSLGWTSIFWVGGVVPLALCVVYIFALPESPRLLALKGNRDDRVASLLHRINPELSFSAGVRFVAQNEARVKGFAVRNLFTDSRVIGTLCIWVMSFMNLLNLNFLLNWAPRSSITRAFPSGKALSSHP